MLCKSSKSCRGALSPFKAFLHMCVLTCACCVLGQAVGDAAGEVADQARAAASDAAARVPKLHLEQATDVKKAG